MILKILVAAAIAAPAGLVVAAPAFADPAAFGDIHCSCQPVIQQFMPTLDDPVEQGIKQGFADTDPGSALDGIPHS